MTDTPAIKFPNETPGYFKIESKPTHVLMAMSDTGRKLMELKQDGTLTLDVNDAGEAATRLVEAVKIQAGLLGYASVFGEEAASALKEEHERLKARVGLLEKTILDIGIEVTAAEAAYTTIAEAGGGTIAGIVITQKEAQLVQATTQVLSLNTLKRAVELGIKKTANS